LGKTIYGSGYITGQEPPGGPDSYTLLLNDVIERLFNRLPDATSIYPGHGKDTTLGTERPQLVSWSEMRV
jgi:glyoxylase-like metal-dependent hydrolase (beta-lactamase superfamily II)